MSKSWYFSPGIVALIFAGDLSIAGAQQPANSTAPAAPREQRQEARQQAQENRQENRQEARQAAQANRPDVRQRLQQRMNNRSQYFGAAEDQEFNNWVTKNNVTPMPRASAAANTVVNAAETALNTAANVAQRAGAGSQAAYGFDNPNPNRTNEWFYDYYSTSPTTYSSVDGSKTYGSASRYYDLNNDGVYDSLQMFRDPDNKGRFAAYDRVDFAGSDTATTDNKSDNQANDGIEDANRYTISGKIYATKTANVNGTKNLIARLSNVTTTSNEKNEITLVDLGPVSSWKASEFKEGGAISASGPVERVGDKSILIADTASVGNEKQERISRSGPQIEGQIVDVTKTQIRGKEHTMAIIESESKRQIIDLGPSDNLKATLEPQTKISVSGIPVRMRNNTVVLAESAKIGDQEISIKRW